MKDETAMLVRDLLGHPCLPGLTPLALTYAVTDSFPASSRVHPRGTGRPPLPGRQAGVPW